MLGLLLPCSSCKGTSAADSPKNVLCPETDPSLPASSCLYHSYEVNRMAIFGTIPVSTAPRPLYRANGVSRLTISVPVWMKPRRFACGDNRQSMDVPACRPQRSQAVVRVCGATRSDVPGRGAGRTPGARARRDSCIRTLMVSVAGGSDFCHQRSVNERGSPRGWQARASIMPAPPPATRRKKFRQCHMRQHAGGPLTNQVGCCRRRFPPTRPLDALRRHGDCVLLNCQTVELAQRARGMLPCRCSLPTRRTGGLQRADPDRSRERRRHEDGQRRAHREESGWKRNESDGKKVQAALARARASSGRTVPASAITKRLDRSGTVAARPAFTPGNAVAPRGRVDERRAGSRGGSLAAIQPQPATAPVLRRRWSRLLLDGAADASGRTVGLRRPSARLPPAPIWPLERSAFQGRSGIACASSR